MTIAGRQYAVIGAATTGIAVASFLTQRGARVRLADKSPQRLEEAGLAAVELWAGDEDPALLRDADVVVPSPGVPRTHPLLRAAMQAGIPIISEIELAARSLTCPILAVTGTNGKSTTTVLLGEMLRQAGFEVFVGGNLGTPLIEACSADARKWEAVVVEVSSFQLEWVVSFRPHVAVILNLTPDHLDRYETIAEYGEAKAALLRMQRRTDFAVLNRDDPWVWRQRDRTRATVVSFGEEPVEFGSFVEGDTIVCWGPRATPLRLSLASALLRGRHNRENIMAAVTAASVFGIPAAAMQRAIDRTKGLSHRLEFVRERGGVRFYDDSKGTNTGAVVKSVASFEGGVTLLLGGYDKGGDFEALAPALRGRVRRIVLFGAAADTIYDQLHRALGEAIPMERAPTLAQAVVLAAGGAESGDTVLLSPGCASFDEFENYSARGRKFRELVEAL